MLNNTDALIYMDTDSLFLSPVEDVWAHFTKFTPYQIAGLTPELSGWYADKTFPFCTETGNSVKQISQPVLAIYNH